MAKQIEELRTFIVQVCKEKMNHELPQAIDDNLPLQEAFQLDSISMFELIVNFEEKYDRQIPDDDIDKIGKMKLEDLHQYLEGQTV